MVLCPINSRTYVLAYAELLRIVNEKTVLSKHPLPFLSFLRRQESKTPAFAGATTFIGRSTKSRPTPRQPVRELAC